VPRALTMHRTCHPVRPRGHSHYQQLTELAASLAV
jgi:hypothetical protein